MEPSRLSANDLSHDDDGALPSGHDDDDDDDGLSSGHPYYHDDCDDCADDCESDHDDEGRAASGVAFMMKVKVGWFFVCIDAE